MTMNRGGKEMKITSHIKERKVEAKESVTTPAGTFECYRISSVIEAETDMPGMDEKSKKTGGNLYEIKLADLKSKS